MDPMESVYHTPRLAEKEQDEGGDTHEETDSEEKIRTLQRRHVEEIAAPTTPEGAPVSRVVARQRWIRLGSIAVPVLILAVAVWMAYYYGPALFTSIPSTLAPAMERQAVERNMLYISSGNGTLYEWHHTGGSLRVVPYCTNYVRYPQLHQREVSFLLENDRLSDPESHARCILRPERDSYSLSARLSEFHDAHDTPSIFELLKLPKSYEPSTDRAAAYAVLAERTHMEHALNDTSPHVFVLRDGRQYVALTLRTAVNVIERRAIEVSDLYAFLDSWKSLVNQRVLGAPVEYCLCSAHLGILDDISFYFDRHAATDGARYHGQWQLWLQPRVTRVNTMDGRMRHSNAQYSEAISPFPFYQNRRIMREAAGADYGTGLEHYVTVNVRYLSVEKLVVPDHLDARERFWMGHGEVKRVHSSNAPFALAVPLEDGKHGRERSLTGEETVCYYHCRYLHHLLKGGNVNSATA